MIDTHCHLTFDQYAGRADQVVRQARHAGLRGLITVAVTAPDAVAASKLAESFDDVWSTAGMHPLYADEPRDWPTLRSVANHPKCIAWGELGLDNHYEKPPRALQDAVLNQQLAMIEAAAAEGVDLPLILHCREAYDDLIAVLRSASIDPARCVFHCFTGGPDEARRVLDFGAWISFTGVVTFKNAKEVAEAAKIVPSDRIMVETDAPYLSPEPIRGRQPNEPAYVAYTARFLADLRGMGYEDLVDRTAENTRRFFDL